MPVESVVPHLSSIVEDGTLGTLDNLLQALVLIFGTYPAELIMEKLDRGGTFHQIVKVSNISLVVLIVVELECFRRNMGRKGVLGVREVWESERHDGCCGS